MNHDAARAIIWHLTHDGMRSEPYKAYGPRAFLTQEHGLRSSDTMQTFVCQIIWTPDEYRPRDETYHLSDISVAIVKHTYHLVKVFVESLRKKGWPVEAAYSSTLEPHQGGMNSMAQRLFTLEVRCDFKDALPGEDDPIELVKQIVLQAGRQMLSSVALLRERVRPEVQCYSHDWFKGHMDIPLLDDDIARGYKAITEHENVLAPEADVKTAVHLLPPVTQPLTNLASAEGEPAGFSADFMASLK